LSGLSSHPRCLRRQSCFPHHKTPPEVGADLVMTAASGFSASPRLRQSLRALNVDVVLTSRAAGVPIKQATLSDTDRRGNKFKPTDGILVVQGGKWTHVLFRHAKWRTPPRQKGG
jgi:hypothetical protein